MPSIDSSRADNKMYGEKEFIHATLSTNQTAGLSASDPIRFDTAVISYGSVLSLNPATYAFTLKKNTLYRIDSRVKMTGSAASCYCQYGYYNVTTASWLPSSNAKPMGLNYAINESSQPIGGTYYLTGNNNELLQVRIQSPAGLSSFEASYTHIMIESIEEIIPAQVSAVMAESAQSLQNTISQTAHGLTVLTPVHYDYGSSDWVESVAGEETQIIIEVLNVNSFNLCNGGIVTVNAHGLTEGSIYYTDPSTAGDLTTTPPATWNLSIFVIDANTLEINSFYSTGQAPVQYNLGYVSYGYTGAVIQDNDEYDPDAWVARTDGPAPARRELASSDIGGNQLYCIGGQNGSQYQDNDEYDPDVWTSRTSLTVAGKCRAGATTLDDKIYHSGGQDPGYSNDHVEYTPPATDSWTSRANTPANIGYNTSFTINSSVHTCCNGGGAGTENYRYTVDAWTTETAKTTSSWGAASFALDDKGYICGGFNQIQTVEELTDPGTWTARTNLPAPGRHFFAGCVVDSMGYVFCGTSGGIINDVDEYVVNSWTSRTDVPAPTRYQTAATGLGG